VPRDAGFEIQATAKNGNIESKLDLPVTSAGQGQSVTGKVGRGGPHIELVADHGDIEINAMDVPPAPPVPPAAPAPPEPPAPPAPGSKPMRHLHTSKGADAGAQPVVQ
jgi:hypothetical protein